MRRLVSVELRDITTTSARRGASGVFKASTARAEREARARRQDVVFAAELLGAVGIQAGGHEQGVLAAQVEQRAGRDPHHQAIQQVHGHRFASMAAIIAPATKTGVRDAKTGVRDTFS
jgi:hypothetical protein